jgi:hypothetical protein
MNNNYLQKLLNSAKSSRTSAIARMNPLVNSKNNPTLPEDKLTAVNRTALESLQEVARSAISQKASEQAREAGYNTASYIHKLFGNIYGTPHYEDSTPENAIDKLLKIGAGAGGTILGASLGGVPGAALGFLGGMGSSKYLENLFNNLVGYSNNFADSVSGFKFDTSKFGVVAVTFTVTCIYGDIKIDKTFEIGG